MSYDPKTNRYPYTDKTDQHYLIVKKNDHTVFDAKYPYIDKSKSFLFKKFWMRVLLVTLGIPVMRVRLGLRIEGRENLKKHKDLLSGGVISCANHVHLWDYMAVMNGVFPRKTNILVWATNIRGENKHLIRYNGGIPIPDDNLGGTLAYLKAVKGLLNDGGWLHVYAEGSMWEYYAPIRPFKRGIGLLAVECDKPVLPMAFSYRKPGWIRRNIFHQIALYTLRIGEPLTVDKTLPQKKQEADIVRRAHEAVCRLARIENNPYPPIFDDNDRIDDYPPLVFSDEKA